VSEQSDFASDLVLFVVCIAFALAIYRLIHHILWRIFIVPINRQIQALENGVSRLREREAAILLATAASAVDLLPPASTTAPHNEEATMPAKDTEPQPADGDDTLDPNEPGISDEERQQRLDEQQRQAAEGDENA
jgi:hypothetical protein